MARSRPGVWTLLAAVVVVLALSATSPASVTQHDAARAWEGFNLRVVDDSPGAVLMDMTGATVHAWSCRFTDAFPGVPVPAGGGRATRWTNARLLPGGDVLGVFGTYGLVRLDRDSNVVWAHAGGEHSDLDVAPDGRIFVLGSVKGMVRWVNQAEPIIEDFLLVLGPDGTELKRLSLLTAISTSDYSNILKTAEMGRTGSVLGANSVEVLDGTMSDVVPAFRAGNVLVSFRQLDSIAVVDVETGKVVWAQFGMWLGQCDAVQVPGGDVLVMDGRGGERTRVLEYDPVTMEIGWERSVDSALPMDEEWGGSCERLPNGNTLIVESGHGRATEVARDGDVVWKYENRVRAAEGGGLNTMHFDLVRLPDDAGLDWLPGR